jgi:hypothetical protein
MNSRMKLILLRVKHLIIKNSRNYYSPIRELENWSIDQRQKLNYLISFK